MASNDIMNSEVWMCECLECKWHSRPCVELAAFQIGKHVFCTYCTDEEQRTPDNWIGDSPFPGDCCDD